MNYSAINIQGNIVSSEILEKVRTDDIRYQKAADFGLNPSASVRDEINLAWSLAVSHWNVFKSKRENLIDTESGTQETRRYWMLPFFQVLGFELSNSNAEIINGKSYAISHRATNKDGFPIHIVGVNQSLDKRADSGGTRLSPHALVQEYLNNNEHMYALVSNGRFIRILRDATRLSRLSYLEFDLEQIMEEGLYVEFALMYRVLHASRMPDKQDSGAECFLEFYHQEALASGSRIRERLSVAVESSIKELANGLLRNPNNKELREKVLNGDLAAKEYYLHTLRLVYRVLFLLVIEERKLIYPEKRGEELNRKRSIYYDYYSVQRLTKLAEKLIYVDPRKTDLWQSLITTFALFEYEQYGKKLGISPLGAGIFSPNALGIISNQLIDNETLLRVLRYLVTFENEQGQRVRVNYADLDVEEFGSVYEGLLDYDPEITDNAGEPIFGFVKGDDRSSSGSHYTPEELVRPLIKHSLDYLIEDKLKEADPEKGLLSLTICDVACGSGHILLSAARRVGFELAKVRSKEEQPTPSVLRVAVRDVIRHCIYGVDLNPLAVELCKVALWLEAHEPGEPLNFLDHHIKCGNAIVGLAHAEELEKGIASEAFKTLPGDDKEIASAFKKRNDLELKTSGQLSTFDVGKVDSELKDVQGDFLRFAQLPEDTPDQIAKKEKAYQDLTQGKKWWRLKNLADLQVAQFFIPKTTANKEMLTTHSQYMTYLKQGSQIFDRGASMSISQEKHFFHWFLEFPEVFKNGGFDCILGNPPYLGAKYISSRYGKSILEYLTFSFSGTGNRCDLITYFIRRNATLICKDKFVTLISTNSISQGDTRAGSLEYLLNNGFEIIYADKNVRWPGQAAVDVSLISIYHGNWSKFKFFNGQLVQRISSYLDTGENQPPLTLFERNDLIFQGSIILGDGFVLDKNLAEDLLSKEKTNQEIIFRYINGDDLVNNPTQEPSRWVINFSDFEFEKAQQYEDCFSIVEQKVKPERQRWKVDGNGNQIVGEYQLRKPLPLKWWIYAEKRPKLYSKIKLLKSAIAVPLVSKYLTFSIVPANYVFSNKLSIICVESFKEFLILQSTFHECWTWKYSTTMGSSTLNYIPTNCFETFPLPQISSKEEIKLESTGEIYHNFRSQFMQGIQLGLTKTYNLFHSNAIEVQGVDEQNKQIVAVQKHLEKTPNTISFDDAIQGIFNLRDLHKEMDEAVLEAYGWHQDDSKWGKAIQLRHDFYEADYLPENDRLRYTIHPEARKEILKRLLQLNHERYAEEVEAGLHDKKGGKKDTKEKKEKSPKKVKIKESQTQEALFVDQTTKNNLPLKLEENKKDEGLRKIQVGSVVKLQSKDGRVINIACGIQSSDAQSLKTESAFVQALLGKSVGQWVKFGNGFEVLGIE
jgi:methylase of polypeptide subunit release factors/transcription elongation GreA/GreB family factor